MDEGGGSGPSLSGVLDGAEEPLLTIKESSPSGADHLMDGVPAAQAFRHREVMLLQAVLERYSDRSAPASSHQSPLSLSLPTPGSRESLQSLW